MVFRRLVILCAFALAPQLAYADGFVAPFIGATFGGDSGNDSKLTFGLAAGGMGGGIFGGEIDVSYSPNFFGESTTFGDNNITTVMGNLIVGVPLGGQVGAGVRPYFSGGAGLIKTRLHPTAQLDFDKSDLGFDLGGGVLGFFSDRFGLRADVRHFRNFRETDTGRFGLGLGRFNFWRGTVGAAFRF